MVKNLRLPQLLQVGKYLTRLPGQLYERLTFSLGILWELESEKALNKVEDILHDLIVLLIQDFSHLSNL